MTRVEVSKKSNIHVNQILVWELGKASPDLPFLRRWAAALDMRLATLPVSSTERALQRPLDRQRENYVRNNRMAELMLSGEHSLQSIGDIYGVNRERVRQILKNLGVNERHGKEIRVAKYAADLDERIRKIAGTWKRGDSAYKAALEIGTTPAKFRERARNLGLALKHRRILSENTKRVIALSKRGLPYSEIVEMTGLSPTLVSVIRHRHKLTRSYVKPKEMNWPYSRSANGRKDDGSDILTAINAAVPKDIHNEARGDICQTLVLWVLEGMATLPLSKEVIAKAKTGHYKMHPYLYGPKSLDSEIPGFDGLRLIDTIASGREHF